MSAVGNDGILRPHLASVRAAKPDNAITALQQLAGLEIRQEPGTDLRRAMQQEIVEYPAIADQRHVLWAGHADIVTARRNQSKSLDGIRLADDSIIDAKFGEHTAAFGRYRAAARLVARKILAVDEHDTLHAELAEMHGRGQANRPGADNADVGVNDCLASPVHAFRSRHTLASR